MAGRKVAKHRGYDIVESDFLVEESSRLRRALVVPGLKERPDGPILGTAAEAKEFIDAELDARERALEAGTAEFVALVKVRGRASVGVTIPAEVARGLGLDVGDAVEVRIRRKAGPAESPPSD